MCIFCKIANHEIPSSIVYEDDIVIAFLDLSQCTKGHTLVVPKQHFKNIYELDEETASHVFKVIPKIANQIKTVFSPIGLNIINNNEKPLQSVEHFHIHLIPRYEDDGLRIEFDDNSGLYDLSLISEAIKNA